MIEMGRCVDCGHTQPGTKRDDRVEPLAETGCAKCENRFFEVADPDDTKMDVSIAAR